MTNFELLLKKAGLSVPETAKLTGYSEGHIYRWKRDEEKPRDGVINLLQMRIDAKRKRPVETSFNFIDLFAGTQSHGKRRWPLCLYL